jgi:hypothetical protein
MDELVGTLDCPHWGLESAGKANWSPFLAFLLLHWGPAGRTPCFRSGAGTGNPALLASNWKARRDVGPSTGGSSAPSAGKRTRAFDGRHGRRSPAPPPFEIPTSPPHPSSTAPAGVAAAPPGRAATPEKRGGRGRRPEERRDREREGGRGSEAAAGSESAAAVLQHHAPPQIHDWDRSQT